MKFYAQLNENNVCVGISQLNREVVKDNLIEISVFSEDYMWKKYENGQWSTEKFEPTSTAPLNEFEQLQQNNVVLSQTIADLTLQNADLQNQVQTLSQTVAQMQLG
ncbi:hypothetical protein [Clostridium kluyveri]|uniref:hypothetical protein n=1 Tax=Clostridium kluyveri TaxID=1534 RepID=UPI0022474206|nr:hypothetical protein [Clostridium kluyveri]UZQ50613.1 hypothetical protein OP486_00040 [Clostridium kluyveri]UZQ51577.1 hypothetical protein OP486_05195 [Clostridium kluyveri]